MLKILQHQISKYLPSRGPKATLMTLETAPVYQPSSMKMDSWITYVNREANTTCAKYRCKKLDVDKNEDGHFMYWNVQILTNDKENQKCINCWINKYTAHYNTQLHTCGAIFTPGVTFNSSNIFRKRFEAFVQYVMALNLAHISICFRLLTTRNRLR